MPQGKTDFHFTGGLEDGQVLKDISIGPNKTPPNKLHFRPTRQAIKRAGFKDFKMVEYIKKLDKNWLFFVVQIYERQEKPNKHKKGTFYKYIKDLKVGRCESLTKKGIRCMKESLEDKKYCCILHKL